LSGQSRLDAPWALFVAAADMTNARAIIQGVEDPAGLAWSPDSRWLAFASNDGDRQGLWIIEPASGRLVRISSGSGWLHVTWSSTGTKLAALRDEAPLGEDRTQIVLLAKCQYLPVTSQARNEHASGPSRIKHNLSIRGPAVLQTIRDQTLPEVPP